VATLANGLFAFVGDSLPAGQNPDIVAIRKSPNFLDALTPEDTILADCGYQGLHIIISKTNL
jgi:hypothetical protein